MKWTKAEISEDGRLVRLTLSGEKDEVYYVKWVGSGQLETTSQFMTEAIASQFTSEEKQ